VNPIVRANELLHRDLPSLVIDFPHQWVAYGAQGRIALCTTLADLEVAVALVGYGKHDYIVRQLEDWLVGKDALPWAERRADESEHHFSNS
jgi:hypothetical protein